MTGGDKGSKGRKVGQGGAGWSRKASPRRRNSSRHLSQVRCEGDGPWFIGHAHAVLGVIVFYVAFILSVTQ